MTEFTNNFWTSKMDMVYDIEKEGYVVIELDDEHVVFVDEEETEYTMQVSKAGSTIWLI